MRRRPFAFLLLLSSVTATAGCRGSASAANDSKKVSLTVLAAASLSKVFPPIAVRFSGSHPGVTVRFTFAGTDSLVTQVEQGAPADVFAGASKKYGDRLSSEGLVLAQRIFATNRLVLVLPRSDPAGITSLDALTNPIKLVIGAESVPVGSYTRTVLKNLDALYGDRYSEKVLANVVSNEDSVEGVLSKVRLGEADAGFVYVTDAKAAGAAVKTLELPDEAQAVASYPIAVLKESAHKDVAGQFVNFVLGLVGQQLLTAASFGPPTPSA